MLKDEFYHPVAHFHLDGMCQMSAVHVPVSLWQEAELVMVLIAVRPIKSGDTR